MAYSECALQGQTRLRLEWGLDEVVELQQPSFCIYLASKRQCSSGIVDVYPEPKYILFTDQA